MKVKKKIKLQFLGAASTVTGSKFLIQADKKTLLVDCGLFQGLKKLRLLNWSNLPIKPQDIDFVILTHGHLDHTGYLPKLVKSGFRGAIFGTSPTLQITKVILEDSARIQEEDAQRANTRKYSKHKPAKPLYKLKDVENTLPLLSSKNLNVWTTLTKNISFRFRYNGHILGATFVELKIHNKILVFSGDIGRTKDPLMYPPEKPEKADVLLLESTYGDRLHPKNPEDKLSTIINSAFPTYGTIIVPGFAVERIQMLMFMLWRLRKQKRIPQIPVYMDSPMGKDVLDLFQHNLKWHKLSVKEISEMSTEVRIVKTIKESAKLVSDKSSKIVIAGSGMATGGRVLSYLQKHLGNPTSTILFVGYQAAGTRGRQMLDGHHEIKLLGSYYPVKARIENIEGLSAHADQTELIEWLNHLRKKPSKIFLVHGEAQAADALRVKIKDVYNWNAEIPELFDELEF